MASTISDVAIANLALTLIGDKMIVQLDEATSQARAINAVYERVRRSEIRKYAWNFAKKRVVLAPDATAPAFDFSYQFTLPSDCLRILPPNDTDLDWVVEGGKILTNYGDSINLVYLADITDPVLFDEAFIDMFAARLAMSICVRLTGSFEKQQILERGYMGARTEASRVNAFENVAVEPPTDTFIEARL